MPKVETTLVTCDHCATDITYPTGEKYRRIKLEPEDRNLKSLSYIIGTSHGSDFPEKYFCGLGCLELWVKNL